MGRAPCCDKEGLKKGPWTPEEDQKLIDYIEKHGPGNWRSLPKKAGLLRCCKSCRLRWTNYLRPDIKRGRFSFEEEETIIQLHSILGNKWSAIAAKLPGRTDNEIKNYWNTHIRKRLLRMGIDPVTHGPRLDVLDLPSILSSLQNSSLLNVPALLNLQMLLNPELLRLASSLTSSQNSVPISHTLNPSQNPNFGNSLPQNPTYPNVQIASQSKLPIQHIQSFDETDVKPDLVQTLSSTSNFEAVQSGFQPNSQVFNAEPSFNCYVPNHVTQYSSSENSALVSNNSNQSLSSGSSFSSGFSTPCSGPADPLDFLINGINSEDAIENYFSNIVQKLESPAISDVCSS